MIVFGRMQSITVPAGTRFGVAVDEPSASGYAFEPVYDDFLMSLEGRNRIVRDPPGAASTVTFQFMAIAAGDGVLVLELRAPWDDVPAEELRFIVRISPPIA